MEQDREQSQSSKHFRGHLGTKSPKKVMNINETDMSFQGSDVSGYGLRENPKKSWKFSGSKQGTKPMEENFLCKKCGKEFESLRALFGHLRHHSGKQKKGVQCQKCGKRFQSLRALTGHMKLHSDKYKVSDDSGTSSKQNPAEENKLSVKRKRSRRVRYKINSTSSFSSLNESSSGCEFDREIEEAAACLIMLSNQSRFDLVDEFFKNDTVSSDRRIVKNEGGNFVSGFDKPLNIEKPRDGRLDSFVSDSKNVFFEKKANECSQFDSGNASHEETQVESESAIEEFYGVVQFKMPKLGDDSGFVLYDAEIGKGFHDKMEVKAIEAESNEHLIGEIELDQYDLGCTYSKSVKKASLSAELGSSSSESELFHDSPKKNRFKCRTCNKTFPSYQALGGHQTIHRTLKSCIALETQNSAENIQFCDLPETESTCKLVKIDCTESSINRETGETTVKSRESSESKMHNCPICFKVFRSGQALGGHKRAHIRKRLGLGSKEIVVKEEISGVCDILDLNSPAMLDEGAIRNVGLSSVNVSVCR